MGAAPIDFSDLGGKVVEPGASAGAIDFSDLGGKVVQQSSVASRPGVPRPSVDMQMSNTGIALNPTESVAGPGEGSYVAQADPESQARMLGAAAIGAGGAATVANPGAAAATARALTPIAKKYGIKALEGAGLAYGWHLYRELKNVFEGNQ